MFFSTTAIYSFPFPGGLSHFCLTFTKWPANGKCIHFPSYCCSFLQIIIWPSPPSDIFATVQWGCSSAADTREVVLKSFFKKKKTYINIYSKLENWSNQIISDDLLQMQVTDVKTHASLSVALSIFAKSHLLGLLHMHSKQDNLWHQV